jgi:hypothetical protein
MGQNWQSLVFAAALVIIFTVARITEANAWCGPDPVAKCVREWISALLVPVIAIVAAAIAYRQVQAFGFLELMKFLQPEYVRDARRHVRQLLEKETPFAKWEAIDHQNGLDRLRHL